MNARPASLRRRIASAIVAAALLTAGVAVGAAPVHAAASVHTAATDATWTVRTESNGLGAERTSYTYSLNPGGTVTDGLVIANHGTEALDLGVYAADGFTTESGGFDILAAGGQSVGLGAWAKADSDRVTVGPGETVTVPFTVTIPDNATPGDYAGGIVTSLTDQSSGPGVSVDRRLGIRMTLRVGGALTPALAIENPTVSWNGGAVPLVSGDATVTYTLHNTGNTTISGIQAASIAGPFGLLAVDAATIDAPPQLLPGETWNQTVTIPGVAAAVLLTGTVTVTPVTTDASGTTAPLAAVVATATGWAVPWPLLVVLVLIVAAAILIPREVRRRRAAQKAQEDERVAAAVERALAEEKSPELVDSTPSGG